MKRPAILYLIAGFAAVSMALAFMIPVPLKRLSGTIHIKQLSKGVAIKSEADFHYAADGKLVTHFTEPEEMIIITNRLGELKVYFPKDNTIAHKISDEYATGNTFFDHFLRKNLTDMGLAKTGMILKDTHYEEGYEVNTYVPAYADRHPLKMVELVFKNDLPTYIGYTDQQNKLIKKVYFTDYVHLGDIDLPCKMTEINILGKGDSMITRTSYSDFLLNEAAPEKYYQFKIPDNATKCE